MLSLYMVVDCLHLIRMDQEKYLVVMYFIMQNTFLKLSSFATARLKLCYQSTEMLEEEEKNVETAVSVEDGIDCLTKIDKLNYFLEVLQCDMMEIKERFSIDIDVIRNDIRKELKIFREYVSSGGGIDASDVKKHEECLLRIAVMSRKLSLLVKGMEHELGIRDGLYAVKKQTMLAMRYNYEQRHRYTKSCFRDRSGKRSYVHIPKHKTLTKRSLTPPTQNDEE
jgi:hypothetical protein